MTKKQEALVIGHMDMVARIAGAAARRNPAFNFEDLLSAGYVGLVQAAQRYKRNRNSNFVAYANLRVKGAVMDAMKRGNYREAGHLPLSHASDVGSWTAINEDLDRERTRERVQGALNALQEPSRTSVMLWSAGETFQSIAETSGRSLKRVREEIRSGLSVMRRELELRGRMLVDS